MSSELVQAQRAELARAEASVERFACLHLSEATKEAYAKDWRSFEAWCCSAGRDTIPASPQTLALYLASQADAGMTYATITRRLAGITKAHKLLGLDCPRGHSGVLVVLQGIRRALGVAQKQAHAVTPKELGKMVASAAPKDRSGERQRRYLRNRAMLTLGFAGAFRRSELAGLDQADVETVPEGLRVTLRRSKTDQGARGTTKGIPFGSRHETCPVRAVKEWVRVHRGDSAARLFVDLQTGAALSGEAVGRVIKRAGRRAGLEGVTGHSLRAGLATSAAAAGKPVHVIMKQTGHTSVEMVMRYIREGTLFEDNAAEGLL